jgi:kumamolisin
MLGLYLRLLELTGQPFDFVSVVAGNATVCFDVTSGNNGAFRAGPGRDEATGFGVVDGTLLLNVLKASGPPVVTPPPPDPTGPSDADRALVTAFKTWETSVGLD